jgi:hypothetical protein
MNNQRSSFQALTGAFSSVRARDKQREIEQEANERGVSISVVARERFEAEQERIRADQERVQALINDPATLRALQAMAAPRKRQADGTFAPVPTTPEPEPAPRDPNAPPSAGRQISPPRAR